ncbi:hypothetical protein EJ04DRAFT_608176 [Polyplosphaeria fusca]|uniref:Uncharacterized protein n=1 Tax=Polyplosphaeria fusca TaxID=682080 RepID=A0A9P4V0X8_9PLEO|nr:hypothetical protein EJ04DRAFT_608176 [Polyplosphaeria fusca]
MQNPGFKSTLTSLYPVNLKSSTTTTSTITIHATATPNMVAPPEALAQLIGDIWPDTIPYKGCMMWALVLLPCWLIIYSSLSWEERRQKARLEDAAKRGMDKILWPRIWNEPDWPNLFGLIELYLGGKIRVGPWKLRDLVERWEDKYYLGRLCRLAIMPCYVQDGGLSTWKERDLSWTGLRLPSYVQSKRRAYLDCIIPHPHEEPRNVLIDLLAEQRDYVATICIRDHRNNRHFRKTKDQAGDRKLKLTGVPLAIGSRSVFPFLLPFKQDTILDEGVDDTFRTWKEYKKAEGLSENGWRLFEQAEQVAFVHIEARDFSQGHRLDEWLFKLAKEANIRDMWFEGDRFNMFEKHLDERV